jgi:transposase
VPHWLLLQNESGKETVRMERNIIGIDTAKEVFQVHAGGGLKQISQLARLSRAKFLAHFAKLPPAVIGMEACGSSHYWARELIKLGHEVKLIPPQIVKGFVPGPMKSDSRDARGCYLAVQQPDIHFVPVKSEEHQAGCALHRAQELLARQRTQTANQLRGLCAEFGLVCAKGLRALVEQLEAIEQGRLVVPIVLRQMLAIMTGHLRSIHAREQDLAARIAAQARASALACRLMKVPGIGPVTAHALAVGVVDPAAFSSARRFAAWLGLTPGLHASGNKSRLGRITKRGDETLRRLLVQGASSCAKAAKRAPHKADPRLQALLARKPYKVAVVAKAARTARIVWAMMTRDEEYRPSSAQQTTVAA